MGDYIPKEIATAMVNAGTAKTALSRDRVLVLAFLAGAYIAFGAGAATMGAHDIASYGAARILSGMLFSCGLILVLVAGGELFTGNVLIWMGVLERQVSVSAMLVNWFWVYGANAVGAVTVAYLMSLSGLWESNHDLVGAYAIKIAVGKLSLSFTEALVRGILCNWMVCLGVWMAYACKDVLGKIWAIFFPITLFVTANFEHSIANLYYVPAGIFAAGDPAMLAAAHVGDKAGVLTWSTFILDNLVPVTLGNSIGGALFVGTLYWRVYVAGNRATADLPSPRGLPTARR